MILPKQEQAVQLLRIRGKQKTIVDIYKECRAFADDVRKAMVQAAQEADSLIELDNAPDFPHAELKFRCLGKRVVLLADFVNNKEGCGINLIPYLNPMHDTNSLLRLDDGRIRVTPNGKVLIRQFALPRTEGAAIITLLLHALIPD